MATTLPPPKTKRGGTGRNGYRDGGGGGGDGRGGPGGDSRSNPVRIGMFFALASIGMLFIAMTSAYVVRRGLGTDWQTIRMPQVLWFNSAVLLASSLALEKARRAFATRWIGITLLLGAVFLGGQVSAWRALSAQGVFISTNPHSSFFYLLTGLHGAHVLGGLGALAWVMTAPRPRRLEAAAIYWHFMFGLWIFLMVLLFGGF